MKPGDKIKLPKAVARIYEAVEELRQEFPGRPFTRSGRDNRLNLSSFI